MATSPFVPDIAPLAQSLQQFTPRARELGRFQLAGLQQQQDIRGQQLEQTERENRRAQRQFMAEKNRDSLLGDIADLDFVLKQGPEGLANAFRLIGQEKGQESEDFPEIINFFNQASIDPQSTFQQLSLNRERAKTQLQAVDAALSRAAPTKFQKTASFLVRNDDGSTGIVTGVFDPSTGGLTTETTAFRADQLVSQLGETAQEQTTRRVGQAESIAQVQAGVELGTQPQITEAVAKAQERGKLTVEGKRQTQKLNTARIAELSKNAKPRTSATKKAQQFLDALSSGQAHSGAGRQAAQFIPGVFTSQGQFDEKLNAFAEIAAREKLKAAGEIRPTDADVEGMKRAMFGIGRDEKTNIELLQEFINDQNDLDSELNELVGARRAGTLDTFTVGVPKTFKPIDAGDTPEGTVAQSPEGVQIHVINGKWILK